MRKQTSEDEQKVLILNQLSNLIESRDKIYSELGQAAALMMATDHDKFFKGNLDNLDNYLAVARNFVVGAYETYQHLDVLIHDLSERVKILIR